MKCLALDTLTQVHNTIVPILLYACEVWGLDALGCVEKVPASF